MTYEYSEDKLIEPDVFLKPGKEELFIDQMGDPWLTDKKILKEIPEVVKEVPENENERIERRNLPQFPEPPQR